MRIEIDDTAIEMLVTLEKVPLYREELSKAVSDAVVQYICLLLEADDENELDPARVNKVEKLVSEYWKEN